MHAVPAGHTSLIRPANDPSVPWPTLLITLPLLGFYYWGTSQAMVQRTLSAKNINHGRWGNLFAAALNFVIFFVMVLPGLSGRVLFPHLDKPDQVYPKLVFEVLPPGLVGLVVTGFLAALTAALWSARPSIVDAGFTTPTRFDLRVHLPCQGAEEPPLHLRLAFHAGSWRVVRVWVPQDLMDRAGART